MVINIEVGKLLQLAILLLFLFIGSMRHYKRKRKFDSDFITTIILSLSSGALFFAGITWMVKPFMIIDNAIFDDPKYAFMIGGVLIYVSILSLKKIGKKSEKLDEE